MTEFWRIALPMVAAVAFIVGVYVGARMTAWFYRSER